MLTVKTDDPAFRGDESNNLVASAAPQETNAAAKLTYDELAPIVGAAIDRLIESLILDESDSALLDEISFEITELSDLTLGQATGTTVLIDITAAGYGWFVDETPYEDSEFDGNSGEPLVAEDMDLLTVVMHELGHILGYDDIKAEDDPGNLMSDTLDGGIRRTDLNVDASTASSLINPIMLHPMFGNLLKKKLLWYVWKK